MQNFEKLLLFRKKRYFVYSLITIILIILPFIKINGNHIFLLSFVHMQLQLVGVSFSVQELYLMPFLLIILFIGVFFMTTLGGRIWCGWSCPQTIFRVIYRDLIQTKLLKLRKKITNKQQKLKFNLFSNDFKELVAILLFSIIAFMSSAVLLFYFIPPEDFFSYLKDPLDHGVFLGFWICISLFLIADITFIAENFCIYMCPYARVQSVLFDDDTLMAVYDEKRGGAVYAPNGEKLSLAPKKTNPSAECINCENCVKICPTHIDIRKGIQLECINCLECVDACTEVMAKYNKPSLVQWTSPNSMESKKKVNYFRFKTIGYIIILAIIFGIMLFVGSKKATMILDINHSGELYEIRANNIVDNEYIFLFQNTDNKDHVYSFKVLNPDIEILRPTEPFKLMAGKKMKQVVILRAKKPLAESDIKDTTIPIQIKAYAIDDPNKIQTIQKSVFVYPRIDLLKK